LGPEAKSRPPTVGEKEGHITTEITRRKKAEQGGVIGTRGNLEFLYSNFINMREKCSIPQRGRNEKTRKAAKKYPIGTRGNVTE